MKLRKNKMVKVILSILVVILILVFILVGRGIYLSIPTKGEKIDNKYSEKSALLVIDMQNDTVNNPVYKNVENLVNNVENEITKAEQNGMDIIFIKQVFSSNPVDSILSMGKYKENTKGTELINEMSPESHKVFEKQKNDSFSVKDFENYLEEKKIGSLYIVGADISACVSATSLGAVNRGYKVVLLEDAIFSVDDNIYKKAKDKLAEQDVHFQ